MVNVDYISNANASANANAKVLLNLFLQQYPCIHASMHPCTHAPMHTSFFLFGWVGGCCVSSSARGPLDISNANENAKC